jgi:predicted amidohydrolase YtcJ
VHVCGLNAGLPVTREQAIPLDHDQSRLGTGIDGVTGSLEPGKSADVVLWSGDPFSVYTKAERVYNEGRLVFDRNDPAHQLQTDFNLGITAPGIDP